ncbi:hypothetical protein [Brevibacillus borstelensis]|uniref:hypothetical protein n=1 Tax=Brevibacillus borstelensis TaxID=45462 RepID=UPI0030C08D76
MGSGFELFGGGVTVTGSLTSPTNPQMYDLWVKANVSISKKVARKSDEGIIDTQLLLRIVDPDNLYKESYELILVDNDSIEVSSSYIVSAKYRKGSEWAYYPVYYWDGTKWVLITLEKFQVYACSSRERVRVTLDANGVEIFRRTAIIGQYDVEYSVAVDPKGGVYIGDNRTVKKYCSWQYNLPDDSYVRDVAVDKQGYVYAARDLNKAITKISPSGSYVAGQTFPAVVKKLAVNSEQAAVMGTDAPDNKVYKTQNGFTIAWTFTEHTDAVNGVAFDQQGYVYTASADKTAKKITPDGSKVWSFQAAGALKAIALDLNANVYVAGDSDLKKVGPNGGTKTNYTRFAPGLYHNISLDQFDNIYHSTDRLIQKLNNSGELIWKYTGLTQSIDRMAVDPGPSGAFPYLW